MNWKSRIERLEARRPRYHPDHFTSIVRVPAHIPSEDWEAWLAEQPCPYGVVGCPDRHTGRLVPTPLTINAWEARYAG